MIYIVEDDAAIRELEQYALQSSGYEVQSFETSEPFWQAMRTAEPELVILDVMLPGEGRFLHPEKAPQYPCSAPPAHHHGHSKIQRAGYRARAGLRCR